MAWRVILSVLFLISSIPRSVAVGAPQVPCYFIFGDSLADNGNNNDLDTDAKANYPPYGIDFHEGATGRFTNGRNFVDIIAELLGFDEYIPPFATAKGGDILRGVNYASGGAGIRDETGRQLGDRISLNHQLQNHMVTISRIREMLGADAATYLNKCVYTIWMGSNDYINNYWMPDIYPTSKLYTPKQYAVVLIEQYEQQLKTLYSYGARRLAIFGLSEIGCTPAEISEYGTEGSLCVDKLDGEVMPFNDRLKPLIHELNRNLTGARFIYVNTYGISTTAVPAVPVTCSTCCEVKEDDQCIPFRTPCLDRSLQSYYDGFHPTETVHMEVAAIGYRALLASDAYPSDPGLDIASFTALPTVGSITSDK
ncbi:GDSL esterase/lipase At4g18970-like [Rhodamnia argentea]|uniref:GDSL esterase/lipase At4g18970-like n=1 Tax=Rhodamnia argentea TaxID=178133 RepID=A0A8B8MRS6_9MYRT|nr:GDSL esterase/lipase At4g18970-like [Rhodamnia argentea]